MVRYLAMEFTAEQIYEIIQKLTGRIRPQGESNQDAESLKNVETFIQVFKMMHIEIDDIAYKYKDSPYASEKRIGERCDKHIDSMGISNCGCVGYCTQRQSI